MLLKSQALREYNFRRFGMQEKRLFAAVEIPEKQRKELFKKYSKILDSEKFKLVKPESLHLTLMFFGNVSVEKIPMLEEKLSRVSAGKFKLKIEDAGFFGKNVLWIGVSEGMQELEELAGQARKAVGFFGEEFQAHLTIARNRNASSLEFAQAFRRIQEAKLSAGFSVDSFKLLESKLLPQGPRHSVLKSFALSSP